MAREGRECVDHLTYVADLADDDVRAVLEHVRLRGDLAKISALQPLGGELDWRERILDFVGNALGNIGPRCPPLRRDQRGDVVEGDDEAVDPLIGALGHDAHEQGAASLAADQFDLILDQRMGLRSRLVQQVGHFGHRLLEGVAGEVVLTGIEQRKCGRVG